MKECLLGYNQSKIKDIVCQLGEKSFRAGQIYKSLHIGLDFAEMTELSKSFREQLQSQYVAQPIEIIKSLKSVSVT